MAAALRGRLASELKRSAPATRMKEVEFASSDADYEVPFGATVYVGTQGDLKATACFSSAPATLKDVAGFVPVSLRTIHADGTTAQDIVVLW